MYKKFEKVMCKGCVYCENVYHNKYECHRGIPTPDKDCRALWPIVRYNNV